MKKVFPWLITAILLVAIITTATILYNRFSEEYVPEMPEGESSVSAPDFTVFDMEGNPVNLSDFKGKPVVINFWATWCHFCKEGMPNFQAAYEKYPDVQFLMVNATDGVQETEANARAYIKEKGYTFDVFFDLRSDAATKYRLVSFPTTCFIDRNGNLIARASGMLDMASLEDGISMIGG